MPKGSKGKGDKKAAPKSASAGGKMGKLEKAKAAGRRASVVASGLSEAKASASRQSEQELALAMQKDYLAMVSGDKVWLWPTQNDAKKSHAIEVHQMEGGVDYWTKGGTNIKWEGDKISFNGSTSIGYEETVQAMADRAVAMAEAGEEEPDEDEEVAISLKETKAFAFGGMQLQEVRGAVYVRDLFEGGSAASAEVKPGWKVKAVKGIPFTTLFELGEKYRQFKIKTNDLVPFMFDASEKSSLWTVVADDSGANEPLGQYRAERGVPYREQSDPDSAEVGRLNMNDVVGYTEACTDKAGRTFLKFQQDGKEVWVSTSDETGAVLMDRLNDDGTDRNTSGSQKKHGDYYRVHIQADVRQSSDPESKLVDGEAGSPATCVVPGEIIEVFEQTKVREIAMIRCAKGWLRVLTEEGGVVAKRIPFGDSMAGVEPPAVVNVEDPEQTYMWDVFEQERTCEITVDASLRTVCRKELQVRTLSLADSGAVRVGIRKIRNKKTPAVARNEESIIEDVNQLQQEDLFAWLKQDSFNFKKPIRSLMDIELQTSYVTDAGNTLERKDLQTVTVGGRFDVPVQNQDPEKSWVWMSRAKVHAATASTIHMLSGMMSSAPDTSGSPRDGTPRGHDEPVLIFFVRQENTHPGTVKRMKSGTFKFCAGGAEPHLLVTQCQTSSEKFGEIEKDSWWQAIGKAAVRTGYELDTAKVGSLQPGQVIQVKKVETSENGSVRINFDTGRGLRGWASVATADGTVLMDSVTEEDAVAALASMGDLEMDSDDDDEEDDGGVDPNAGRYRVVKKSVVRATSSMQSPKVGDPLEVDDEIVVSRAKFNPDTGQLRLKFYRGWTSLNNAEGVALLEKIEEAPAPAAAAEGDAEAEATPEPEPELEQEGSGEMTAYQRMQARDEAEKARIAAAEEDEEAGVFSPMEQYLDAFLAQEIVCKYGLFESISDDDKTMTMPAIAFHCAKAESAEHLTKKREKIIDPFAGKVAAPVAISTRAEAGTLNITMKETKVVDVTDAKNPSKKTSIRYLLNVEKKNEKGEGSSWIITKSYTDFINLNAALSKALGPANQKLLPPLPSKHSKHQKDKDAVIETRKKAVESYVVLATMHPMIAMHEALDKFCNSDKSDMEYTFAEEEEVVDEGPNTVIEKIDGIDSKSTDKEVEGYMDLKGASKENMKFVVEDDHAAFPAKEKLASMCNRLENGRGAQDMFLTPTVGRAVSRLMLWSYAHTWCATMRPHEGAAKVMYDVMERGETPSNAELESAMKALAEGQAGRDAFKVICGKLTGSYWEDNVYDSAKALIEAVLSAVIESSDYSTGSVALDLINKMGFKREVRKHGAWHDLEFWEGVLVSKIGEAQSQTLQLKKTIAADGDKAAENSELASRETRSLLLHMLEFRVPKDKCVEFVGSSVALVDVLTAEDRTEVEEYIANLEEDSESEEEDIAEGVPPEDEDEMAVMEEVDEEEEEDDEEEDEGDGRPPDSPARTESAATDDTEGGDAGEEVHEGGEGLSQEEIEKMAMQAMMGGAPQEAEEEQATAPKTKFGSAGLFANSTRARVGRDDSDDSSSEPDSDDSDDISDMPLGSPQNKMMRRPMGGDYSSGGTSKGSMARRASLAMAAAAGPSSPGRGGMGLGGRTTSTGKGLIDSVLTPTNSAQSSEGDV